MTLNLEQLESRLVPYTLAGKAWPEPLTITVSFLPDGVLAPNYQVNQIHKYFDAR